MIPGIENVFTPRPVFLATAAMPPVMDIEAAPPPTPQLDHRVAQLEATVAAQARELRELRLALTSVVATLQRLDGDGC